MDAQNPDHKSVQALKAAAEVVASALQGLPVGISVEKQPLGEPLRDPTTPKAQVRPTHGE